MATRFEKSNGGLGNDTVARATSLGALTAGGTLGDRFRRGRRPDASVRSRPTSSASTTTPTPISFRSRSRRRCRVDVTLTPLGGVFNQGVEGGHESSFNANARNDLTLSVFASNGTTLLGSANLAAAGGVESLSDLSLTSAGKYFARVTGADANVQLYQLQLSATALSVVLAGDYNRDGIVDARDYTVWRNSLRSGGQNLAADGNGDGTVERGRLRHLEDTTLAPAPTSAAVASLSAVACLSRGASFSSSSRSRLSHLRACGETIARDTLSHESVYKSAMLRSFAHLFMQCIDAFRKMRDQLGIIHTNTREVLGNSGRATTF